MTSVIINSVDRALDILNYLYEQGKKFPSHRSAKIWIYTRARFIGHWQHWKAKTLWKRILKQKNTVLV